MPTRPVRGAAYPVSVRCCTTVHVHDAVVIGASQAGLCRRHSTCAGHHQRAFNLRVAAGVLCSYPAYTTSSRTGPGPPRISRSGCRRVRQSPCTHSVRGFEPNEAHHQRGSKRPLVMESPSCNARRPRRLFRETRDLPMFRLARAAEDRKHPNNTRLPLPDPLPESSRSLSF
jgi:hypothetical protein